jgi:autotransporter family porin
LNQKTTNNSFFNQTKILLPLLLLSLALIFTVSVKDVSAADGDTIYVNASGGNDSNTGYTPSEAKLSIANATRTVNNNGNVNIADGTYSGVNNTNINIAKNMTIIGESQTGTIIDAQNLAQIFNINFGITLNLKEVTLTNGMSQYGGAIYNGGGTLTVDNSTFTNNSAFFFGGAIYNENDGNLTVDNCTFTNNTAEHVDGGAIANSDGTLTVVNCTFTNNTGSTGGAICNENGGTLTVDNSTFTNNTARGRGGAIGNFGGTNLTIENSTFTNNTASSTGGAIYNWDTMTVTGNTFTNNTAYDGGAIHNYNTGTMTVTSNTFTDNTATNGGGAIYNARISTVTGNTFTENTASLGGAIYNNYGSILTLTDCDFTGNIETFNDYFGGAAIYNNGTCTVTGSNFTENNASASDGAAIHSFGPLTITGCTFTDNEGGAVIIMGSTLDIISSTFTGNHAIWDGAAIYNEGSLNVLDSIFTGNIAGRYGGVLLNNGTATMHFNRIVGNSDSLGYSIYNDVEFGDLNATDNWWGSNSPNFGAIIYGEDVIYSPWLYLTFSAIPATIPQGSNSTLTASFNQHTDGITVTPIDPAFGHIPDGSPVTFTTTLGNVGSKSVLKYTVLGIATAILRGDEAAGDALVGLLADGQPLTSRVTITPVANAATTTTASVNAATTGTGNTVGMQTTGAPIVPLAIAVLSVLGGLAAIRKKQ